MGDVSFFKFYRNHSVRLMNDRCTWMIGETESKKQPFYLLWIELSIPIKILVHIIVYFYIKEKGSSMGTYRIHDYISITTSCILQIRKRIVVDRYL